MALVVEVSAWVPHSSQAACQSNFSKNVQTPRRGARAWLCPAPCAGCRAPWRGRGRCAGAGASATRSRGAARLEGHKQHLPPARAHEQKVAGLTELVRALRAGFSGPGRSPRWQWLLGRASCLALRSCRRQRYEDGQGVRVPYTSACSSLRRGHTRIACARSLARKRNLLHTGGQT